VKVWAQAAPSKTSITDEDWLRAQRDADKVLDRLRRLPAAAPAPTPAPTPAPAAQPQPKSQTKSQSKTKQQPAAKETSAAPVATKSTPAAAPAVATPEVSDFESTMEDFAINDGSRWGKVEGSSLTRVSEASHGSYALQVQTPLDSWVGVDFAQSPDWSNYQYLVFELNSKIGFNGTIGLKTGASWDWCEVHATAVTEAKGFTTYRTPLASNSCPNVDKKMVRGFHMRVKAGDTVVMDHFRLE
jgi:hypothetical protein